MSEASPLAEYLVLSRGQWDKAKSKEEIQKAIDDFYIWHAKCVIEGRMKGGQRLAREGKLVSRRAITDGPFIETREIIGGYWFILARTLDEAASIAAENPCLACGLSYEVRPVEAERASAFDTTCETPDR